MTGVTSAVVAKRKAITKRCTVCDSSYETRAGNSLVCSSTCADEKRRVRNLAKATSLPLIACAGCGRLMKQLGPKHQYCMASACRKMKWERDWREEWTPMLHAQVVREAAWEAVRKRRERLEWLKQDDRFGSSRWRAEQNALLEQEIAEAIEASDELEKLVAEQARDVKFGGWSERRWELSLDAPIGESSSLLEFVDDTGRVRIGQGFHPDFTEALCALMDVKRDIDTWAEEGAA